MLFEINTVKKINSLKDIWEKKQMLIEQADAKSIKIKSRLGKLVKKTSPQLVFDEILEKFELQNSLLNFLPFLLKYRHPITGSELFSKIRNSPKKRAVIIGIGALLTGVATYLYLNRNKQTTEEQ
jgi:hypothetical protein